MAPRLTVRLTISESRVRYGRHLAVKRYLSITAGTPMVQTSDLISRHVVVRIHPRGPITYASRTSVQLELIPLTCLERNQGLAPNKSETGQVQSPD